MKEEDKDISISKKKALLEKTKHKLNDQMKKTTEKIKDAEKEIDLLEVSSNVFNSLKQGFVKLFTLLFSTSKSILQVFIQVVMLFFNSWKFAMIVLAFLVGATVYLYKSNEPYYNSDGYGISRITGSQEVIQIINSISIPNDELNIALKNDLQLPPNVYNNIKSIKASWLIDENGDGIADFVDYDNDYQFDEEEDSIARRMIDRFNVRLQLTDQSISNQVEDALITYLHSHPFIKNLNDSRLQNLEGMIDVYSNQAEVLDSLQYYEYFQEDRIKMQNVQSLKFGEFELIGGTEDQQEKRLYHENIISLKEDVVQNQAALRYSIEPIVFVGSFTNTTVRANSLMFYGKKMAFIIIPLAFLIFIFIKRRELEEIFNIKALSN